MWPSYIIFLDTLAEQEMDLEYIANTGVFKFFKQETRLKN